MHGALVLAQGARIPIDRDDPPAWSEQIGQRERECPVSGPHIGPRSAGLDGGPQQPDVIGVVHGGSLARALEPGRDAVDGEMDEAEDALPLGIAGRQRPHPGEQPDLELRERIHVRVAERDRSLQDR